MRPIRSTDLWIVVGGVEVSSTSSDWDGYGLEHRAWTPARFILDKDLIRDYHRNEPDSSFEDAKRRLLVCGVGGGGVCCFLSRWSCVHVSGCFPGLVGFPAPPSFTPRLHNDYLLYIM